ncbi:MAG: aminopeptidase [Alphaproteobacteria bacterium]|nr:aminopeptidase [Alphaproteobacteria bacterium]
MKQENLQKLAKQFITTALAAQKGEKIWLQWAGDDATPLADACKAYAESIGVEVRGENRGSAYVNNILAGAPSIDEIKALDQKDLADMQDMDCFLGIGEVGDRTKLKDFGELSDNYRKYASDQVTEYRVNNTRWLVVKAPSEAFAKACGMSQDDFEAFYLGANLFDHSKMEAPAEQLNKILREGKHVHIKGQGTDLEFSIDGIGARSCIGKRNLPDGEVYTAPVKGSVNGHVTFGPSFYNGKSFDEIFLRYKDGKIVEAKSTDEQSTADLNRILDTDEGARYPGEFAIAFNPNILEPVGDILFDEKIAGSFHIASGQCYKQADNGNESSVHWDMVQIQRPEHGGGTIAIDGRVIRRDGLFVVPELEALNPANLLKP